MSHRPPFRVDYRKPWLDYAEQLAHLERFGLGVDDRTAAEQFLAHVNYFRLRGYFLAFRDTKSRRFFPNTTFEHIRECYVFDIAMRDLLSDAIEIVEVDLRCCLAHHFGQRHGAYGHTEAHRFFFRFDHKKWLTRVRDGVMQSKEDFVTHFRNRYTKYPDLPVWVLTEAMSFGHLSHMLSGMLDEHLAPIARRYQIKIKTLQSWAHHLTYVRNLCAHHARVWNRVWSIKPKLPPSRGWSPPELWSNDRLACTLLIAYRMLLNCPSSSSFAANWKQRVEERLCEPPPVLNALSQMGMVPRLENNSLWR